MVLEEGRRQPCRPSSEGAALLTSEGPWGTNAPGDRRQQTLNSAAVCHITSFWVCFLLCYKESLLEVTSKFLPDLISYCSN